jgi:cytoskeletal protein RodZ
MAGNQVTDDDSGEEPQTGPVSSEARADAPDNAEAKGRMGEGVTTDVPSKTADTPKKTEAKADSKTKSKGKDEAQPAPAQKAADVPASDTKAPDAQPPASPASGSQPSKSKSLAEVMKVDLRVRRRRRH